MTPSAKLARFLAGASYVILVLLLGNITLDQHIFVVFATELLVYTIQQQRRLCDQEKEPAELIVEASAACHIRASFHAE